MEELLKILGEINDKADFKNCEDFLEAGLLDSFDIMTLVDSIERQFKIQFLGKDIVPENFVSINAIMRIMAKYGVKI